MFYQKHVKTATSSANNTDQKIKIKTFSHFHSFIGFYFQLANVRTCGKLFIQFDLSN